MIDIQLNGKDFERASRLLQAIPGGIEKAVSSSINRTLTSTRAEAVRGVREQYDIKAKIVRESITVGKSNNNSLSGRIISRGSPIPLINFKVRPKTPNPRRKKPVFASVKKSGSFLGKAFIAEMPNGHIGVYERIGLRRYPIKQLYGPSAPQMVGEKSIIEQMQQKAHETMLDRLEHETIRALGRY